jgi:hypothetical protein
VYLLAKSSGLQAAVVIISTLNFRQCFKNATCQTVFKFCHAINYSFQQQLHEYDITMQSGKPVIHSSSPNIRCSPIFSRKLEKSYFCFDKTEYIIQFFGFSTKISKSYIVKQQSIKILIY